MNPSNQSSHLAQNSNINTFHNGPTMSSMPPNGGPVSGPYSGGQMPQASLNHLTHLLTQPTTFTDNKQHVSSAGSVMASQPRIIHPVSSGQPIEYGADGNIGLSASARMMPMQHQISGPNIMDQPMINGINHVAPSGGGGSMMASSSFESMNNMVNHQSSQNQPVRMGMSQQQYSRHVSNTNMINQNQVHMMQNSANIVNVPQPPQQLQHPQVNQFSSQQQTFTGDPQAQMVNNFNQQQSSSQQTFVNNHQGPIQGGPMPTQPAQDIRQSNNSTGSETSTNMDKQKLIQQQLRLLLHATKCRRSEQESSSCPNHCRQMRTVIHHMSSCNLGKNCPEPHCASSRQIISHYKSCNNVSCPVCQPLKMRSAAARVQQSMSAQQGLPNGTQDMNVPRPQHQGQHPQVVSQVIPNRQMDYHTGSLPNGTSNMVPSGSMSGGQMVGPGQVINDPFAINGITQHDTSQGWRAQVKDGHRTNLVRRIVQTIFPSRDPTAYRDPRMTNLIDYAKKVEHEMFQEARTMDEYFQLLAEKCHKIHKELSEKRRNRLLPNSNDAGASGTTAPISTVANSTATMNNSLISQIAPAQLRVPSELMDGQHQTHNETTPTHQDSDSIINISKFDQALRDEYKRHNEVNGNDAISNCATVGSSLQSPETHMGTVSGTSMSGDVLSSTTNSSSVASYNASMDSGGSAVEVKTEAKICHSPAPSSVENGASSVKIKDEIKDETPATPGSVGSQHSAPTSVSAPSSTDKSIARTASIPKMDFKARNPRLWTREELIRNFIPLLNTIYDENDAAAFRQPVDPIALGIPDYSKVIINPMDLSTIRKKLEDGDYNDPWDVVDDFWLMLNNAWTYNKKTTRVYKITTKVAEIFESKVDPLMQQLGFCCGREYVYLPQVIYCSSPGLCAIAKESVYYEYDNTKKTKTLACDKYLYCEKCFTEPGDEAGVTDDPMAAPVMISKALFIKKKNNKKEPEILFNCKECGRKWHQVCACHLDEIWTEGFVCNTCIKERNLKRKENRFMAKRIPTTTLSNFLEKRVNDYLKKKDVSTGDVTIRVLSSSEKKVDVKSGMRARFTDIGEMAESFPYRLKAIFAYQEIDGNDVCFFGLHVQEYGSECSEPNYRRVYISYLDSVFFFRPKTYRTDVYHEILVGYLNYVKYLGFTMAHIWACPPGEGDDYIFHMHPAEQRIPKPKRLQEWYQKVLEKSRSEGVVLDFRDILRDALETKMTSPTEIPYFEGDFWPNTLEDILKELDAEEKKRKQEEAQAEDDEGSDNDTTEGKKLSDKKKAKKRKGNSRTGINSKRKKSNGPLDMGDELCRRVYETMDKNKDMFFVIRLHKQSDAATLGKIEDPDPLIQSELMDGRDSFLQLARERHLEFSSLRRAKFSTMVMLYELHTEHRREFMYCCNMCNKNIETRYHCESCEEYDLCATCHATNTHQHPLTRIAIGFDDDDSSGGSGASNGQESRRSSLEKFVKVMTHASHCRDVNCRMQNCHKMKQWTLHFKRCKNRLQKKCDLCKRILCLLYYHAKVCQQAACDVPLCSNVKEQLRQQQFRQQQTAVHLLRRRMANMQERGNKPAYSSAPAIAGSPSTAAPAQQSAPSGPPASQPQLQPNMPQYHAAQQQQQFVPQQMPQGYIPQSQYFPQSHAPYNAGNGMEMQQQQTQQQQQPPQAQQIQQNSYHQQQQQRFPSSVNYNNQSMGKGLPPPNSQSMVVQQSQHPMAMDPSQQQQQNPQQQQQQAMWSQQQQQQSQQQQQAQTHMQGPPQSQPGMMPTPMPTSAEINAVENFLTRIRRQYPDPAVNQKELRNWLSTNKQYIPAYQHLVQQHKNRLVNAQSQPAPMQPQLQQQLQQQGNQPNPIQTQQLRGMLMSNHHLTHPPNPQQQHHQQQQPNSQQHNQWVLQQQQQQRFRAQQQPNQPQPQAMIVPPGYMQNTGGPRGPPMMMPSRQQSLPSAGMTFSSRSMQPGVPQQGPVNVYHQSAPEMDPNKLDQRMATYEKM